jgi:tetratricopeptide (TPR) repeat protein
MNTNEEHNTEKSILEKFFIISGSIVLGLIAEFGAANWLPKKSYAVTGIIMIVIAVVIIMAAVDSMVSSMRFLRWRIFNIIAIITLCFLVFLGVFHVKLPNLSARMAYICCEFYDSIESNEYAKGAIEEAIKLNPNEYLYQAEAGRIYFENKCYQQSIDYYEKAIELNPDSDQLYLERGRAYLENQDPFSAVEDFKIIIENNPDNEEYNYLLARAYLNCGYDSDETDPLEKAIEYFKKANDKYADDDEYFYLKACAYIKIGGNENFSNAIEDLTSAINLNANNDNYYYWRGMMFCRMGSYNDYTNAIKDFTAAIKINADVKEYYYQKGLSYYNRAFYKEDNKLKDYEKAIDSFDIAIKIDQEYAECYAKRAWANYECGNNKDGLADIKEAVRLDYNNRSYHESLGCFYYNEKEYAKAIKEYQCANDIEPNALCYFNLGDAYHEDGKLEKAIDAYTDAINMDNANVLYLSRRGLCYSLIQEYDKSKEDLVTIMTLQEHGTEIGY